MKYYSIQDANLGNFAEADIFWIFACGRILKNVMPDVVSPWKSNHLLLYKYN